MDTKKPRTAEEYRQAMENHLNSQPNLKKGAEATELAKARAQHYAKGEDHLKQVAQTLQELAAKHPDPKARKKADMALASLNDAQTAFGQASLCQTVIWNKDDV